MQVFVNCGGFLFGLFLGMVSSFTINYFGYVKKVKALKEDIQSREVEINYYKNEILKLRSNNKLLESKLDLEKAKNKLLNEAVDDIGKRVKLHLKT